MRPTRILAAALLLFPTLAAGQGTDTLRLGERVRVRVASTRQNVNLFVGNVSAISPDTLILALPGGKGTVILPRASISEVAKSEGNESRWRNLPRVAPLALITAATIPLVTQTRSRQVRFQGAALIGLNVSMIAARLGRKPPERWTPLDTWLNR
jgi:hypothetical protein